MPLILVPSPNSLPDLTLLFPSPLDRLAPSSPPLIHNYCPIIPFPRNIFVPYPQGTNISNLCGS